MVIYTESDKKALGANETDTLIRSITPEVGETITILEIAYKCPNDGRISGYLAETKLDNVLGEFLPNQNNRIVVNRELKAGQKFDVKGSSVTAGDFFYLVVYDKVTA